MIICLTGGIGSGKSSVATIFESLGALVFNSDEEAKDLYFDSKIKQQVIELLGSEAYLSSQLLNKSYISAAIFSDKNLLEKLNEIIHPAVIQKFNNLVLKHPTQIIIKETALLFEAQLEKNCDTIVVVVADDAVRIKRVVLRDGINETEVIKKIQSQWSQEEKVKRADYVIYNNEDDLILPQVLKVYQQFLKKLNG